MAEKTLEQQLDADCAAAVKAARPHLMRAWASAVRLGHRGGFEDWLLLVFNDLNAEAEEIAAGIPAAERRQHLHSAWV